MCLARVKVLDGGGVEGPTEAGLVFRGLVPFTMVDFPGRLALTVYTMGCNFRCPICHNREFAVPLTEELPRHDVEAVLEVIRSREVWIDGVCVTGGEPLLQSGLASALARFKDKGLAVKLDTNGCYPEYLKELLDAGLVDYVAMDVKAPLTNEEYSNAAGVRATKWLPKLARSIEIVKGSSVDYEFRTICVPGLHSPEGIGRIAREIAPCRRYVLRAFKPVNTLDPEYENLPPPTADQMRAFLDAAREHVAEVVLG